MRSIRISFSFIIFSIPLILHAIQIPFGFFRTSNLNVATPTIDLLVVGGGGGGGGGDGSAPPSGGIGGGGGSGGVLEQTARPVIAGVTYNIVVGLGGAGGPGDVSGPNGANGENSSFDDVIALGGGGGGFGHNSSTYSFGSAGGSGGGSADRYTASGGAATQGNSGGATGYGFAGAAGLGRGSCAGGGGAGGPGISSTSCSPADNLRGAGRSSNITGSVVIYARGGSNNSDGCFLETPNTGDGGKGGDENFCTNGGAGASGVVILRYPNTYPDPDTVTGSPTIINVGGFKIYIFTSSGSIKW